MFQSNLQLPSVKNRRVHISKSTSLAMGGDAVVTPGPVRSALDPNRPIHQWLHELGIEEPLCGASFDGTTLALTKADRHIVLVRNLTRTEVPSFA